MEREVVGCDLFSLPKPNSWFLFGGIIGLDDAGHQLGPTLLWDGLMEHRVVSDCGGMASSLHLSGLRCPPMTRLVVPVRKTLLPPPEAGRCSSGRHVFSTL